MNFTLHIWRQPRPDTDDTVGTGRMETYRVTDISPDMSFIEMLDVLNANLVREGKDPVAFEADCLEGICGTCCLMINGIAHGPEKGCTTCQTHMRSFTDEDHIYVEPWRAKSFPVIKDLVVDRSAFDRVIQAGGFVSVSTGGSPDANAIPVPKEEADIAFDAAQCIGCGACVASCKNGSAMLFVSAKVGHLAHLPQGQPERYRRVVSMIEAMEREGFGACTNQFECEAVCPKEISVSFIKELNRDYMKAKALGK